MVGIMRREKSSKRKESAEHPSLYEMFNLGDRVKRAYKRGNGKTDMYKGIVMAIEKDYIEVYWDTVNEKYCPSQMKNAFTVCSEEEIFKGSTHYNPIKKIR